jgi:hypothetical protein
MQIAQVSYDYRSRESELVPSAWTCKEPSKRQRRGQQMLSLDVRCRLYNCPSSTPVFNERPSQADNCRCYIDTCLSIQSLTTIVVPHRRWDCPPLRFPISSFQPSESNSNKGSCSMVCFAQHLITSLTSPCPRRSQSGEESSSKMKFKELYQRIHLPDGAPLQLSSST